MPRIPCLGSSLEKSMSVRDHRSSVFVMALGGLLAGSAAFAQNTSLVSPGRTWIDPPIHKPTLPFPVVERENGKPLDGKVAAMPTSAAAPRPIAQLHRRAAAGAKPKLTNRRTDMKVSSPKTAQRGVFAERRAVRPVASKPYAARSLGEKNWTVQAFQPYDSEAPVIRHDYTSEQPPDYRGSRDGRLDEWAARIRLAREAGYLVVRASDLHSLRQHHPRDLSRDSGDRGYLDD